MVPDTLLVPNTSCFQNFCQKTLLETQIGSTSSSQGFFLHHALCFGHNKTCFIADYFHFPNTKRWYDGDWVDFLPTLASLMCQKQSTLLIMAPEHEVQWNHKCCPGISMWLTYFQWWSRGIQPYMPHWKKAKRRLRMLSCNAGGPKGELQESCTHAQFEPGDLLWRATIVSSWSHWAATTQYRKTA